MDNNYIVLLHKTFTQLLVLPSIPMVKKKII